MGDEGCVLLYQIICLHNTPPLNLEEQEKCMKPRTACWRDPSIKCSKAAAEAYFSQAASGAGSHNHKQGTSATL